MKIPKKIRENPKILSVEMVYGYKRKRTYRRPFRRTYRRKRYQRRRAFGARVLATTATRRASLRLGRISRLRGSPPGGGVGRRKRSWGELYEQYAPTAKRIALEAARAYREYNERRRNPGYLTNAEMRRAGIGSAPPPHYYVTDPDPTEHLIGF